MSIEKDEYRYFWSFYKHSNSINEFRPAATHLSRQPRQLAIPIDGRASQIWFIQRIQGRPLRRLPQIPTSKTHLVGASSSIRTTCTSQRSRWILVRCTTSMSLRSSYSSEAEIIANLLWTSSYVELCFRILPRHQGFMHLLHKAGRVR